jgi:hypothetical protein
MGAAALLLVVGYQLGLRSAWSAHHPYLVDGEATRYGKDSSAVFRGPDGTHVWFRMNGVVWKSDQRTGADEMPPCLREPDVKAAVRVGVIEVARPYGSGSYRQILSVTCL